MDVAQALAELKARIVALEKESHPPVKMMVCGICSALVAESSLADHERWHEHND